MKKRDKNLIETEKGVHNLIILIRQQLHCLFTHKNGLNTVFLNTAPIHLPDTCNRRYFSEPPLQCHITRFIQFNDSPIKFNFSPPKTNRGTQIRRRIKKTKRPLHRAKNGDFCIPPIQEPLYFNGFTAYDLIFHCIKISY